MVGTIRPVVYRRRLLANWIVAGFLHVAGNVVGGAAVGLAIGLIATLLSPLVQPRLLALSTVLIALGAAYALDEAGALRMPYPQRARQVPAEWRARFHPYVTAIFYGASLGSGFQTRIISGAVYVAAFGLLLYNDPLYASLAFALFGFGRGGGTFLLGWRARNAFGGREFDRKLQSIIDQQDRVHTLAGVALAFAAGFWMVASLTGPAVIRP